MPIAVKVRIPGPHAPAWVLAEGVAAAGFSLVSMMVIGRVIGPAAAGVGTMAIAAFLLFDIMGAALFSDSLVQRADLQPRHASSAVTAAVLVSFVTAAGLIGIGQLVASTAQTPELGALTLALAPLLPLSAFAGNVSGLLQRQHRFRLLALRLLMGQPVALTAGLIVAREGWGPWAMVAAQGCGTMVTFLLMLRGGAHRLRPVLDRAALRDLLPVAVPQVAGVIVQVGRYRVFALGLGMMVAASVLALANFAFRMLDAGLAVVQQAVGRVALPRLCAVQHDRDALAETYGDFAELQALLGFPICMGLAFTAPDLVYTLLGPEWLGAAEAARVAGMAAILGFAQGDYGSLFVALGQTRRNLYVAIASLGLPLVAIAVLRPQTPEEAALTWTSQSILLPPFLAWVVLKDLNRSPLWLLRRIAPAAIATAAMTAAVLAVRHALDWEPWQRLLASIVIGGTVYLPVALLLLGGHLPRALRSRVPAAAPILAE